MKQIKIAIIMAIVAILIISVIFLSIISPLKGLSILTPLSILLGITIWGFSLILLISGLRNRYKENISKISILSAIILISSFIPIGYLFMKISGEVRTKISIVIVNHSDQIPANISIYGTGDIFENTDTLKLKMLKMGDSLSYRTRAISKPHRSGYIKMEYDFNNERISKIIAGKFSINPYVIKQEWKFIFKNARFN